MRAAGVNIPGTYPIRYPPKILPRSEESSCPAAEELQMALEEVNADIRDILREVVCPTPSPAPRNCSDEPGTTMFEADLRAGVYGIDSPPDMNLSFVVDLEPPDPASGTCDYQGVLKITYPILTPQTRLLRFDMYFNSPTGWNFNIGDSSTNNGFGGDASSTHDEAEVHNLANDDFLVYRNNLRGCNAALHAQLSSAMTNFVTVTIEDEYIEFDNHQGIKECYRSECLFTLAGQMVTGANYDIFFGMNRVISGPGSRTGTGLCRVKIKYLDCEY